MSDAKDPRREASVSASTGRPPARRVFLRVLGAAAAGFAAAACGGETGGTTSGHGHAGGGGAGGGGGMGGGCSGAGVSAGDVSAYAAFGLHQVLGTFVLIGRDSGGLYALSSVCTHRGCNLNYQAKLVFGGIECTCHGSIFRLDGSVQLGPAVSPLPAYALSVECGQLWVDTSQTVPHTERLAV